MQAVAAAAACLAAGTLLSRARVPSSPLLSSAACLTLPALLLHTCPSALRLLLTSPHSLQLAAAAAALHLLLLAVRHRVPAPATPSLTRPQATGSLLLRSASPAERSLALGCLMAPDLFSLSAPLLSLTHPSALLAVALLALPAALGVAVLSPAAFALGRAAGAAAPVGEAARGCREHKDGGVYDGEWLGGEKSGFGVYAYPSGARYAGQWRVNSKHGRGVYEWAEGGRWAGEWRAGARGGLGVRTFASNKPPQAGRWEADKLAENLPLRDAVDAAEAAVAAAAQATRAAEEAAPEGMGRALRRALLLPASLALALCLLPPLLSAAAAAAQSSPLTASAAFLAAATIPPGLAAIAQPLAQAHRPLCLLALGAAAMDAAWQAPQALSALFDAADTGSAKQRLPPPPILRTALAALAVKYIASLLLLPPILALLPLALGGAQTLPPGLPLLLACLLLAPVSPTAAASASAFRNTQRRAAPLVALTSLPVSGACWAVLWGVQRWTAGGPAEAAALSGACVLLALLCGLAAAAGRAALAPRRMVLDRDAFEAASAARRDAAAAAAGGGGVAASAMCPLPQAARTCAPAPTLRLPVSAPLRLALGRGLRGRAAAPTLRLGGRRAASAVLVRSALALA